MNEFDALLARAVEQARALGIPVSARISPRVAAMPSRASWRPPAR